ncbi:MAG: hypothetical protein WBJ33_09460 [Candidatus Nanopelagicales bacterium]|jgi:hypothetical protein
MRRLVWASLGAAGGILAYRKIEQFAADAKDKGVILTVTDVSNSVRGLAAGASDQIARYRAGSILREAASESPVSGRAAAMVRTQSFD